MPGRDMTGTGRYPPQPRCHPFSFYSAVRLGDPEALSKIMAMDPYFITQDNGAGAPLHFAVTYCQLDMVHHLINNGAEVNQRDPRGFTPLHRAAYLAHLNGYIEIYEYLLSRGADPSIKTDDYDPYLSPGCKTALEVSLDDEDLRGRLTALDRQYDSIAKVREPHPDVGDWWAVYDYGLDTVKTWDKTYSHPYPEELKRARDLTRQRARRAAKKAQKEEYLQALADGRNEVELMRIAGSGPKAAPTAVSSAPAPQAPPPAAAAPSGPVAFLFPGQGSQVVGMLADAAKLPAVRAMLDTAQRVLGYDLLDVCVSGPKEKLDDTIYSQPALFVAGLAAVEKLRASDPVAVDSCAAVAGLSLGEYTALVFAGALSFEDGLRVVKARAASMAAAAKGAGRPHGMLSVVGLQDDALAGLCTDALGNMPDGTVCRIANSLFPQGRVVSGHLDALALVQEAALGRGALKATMLAVSGAFHTPLMEPARADVIKALQSVTFSAPRVPVYSNVTAEPFTSAEDIPRLLAQQLVEPVMWEQTLTAMLKSGKRELYELGPSQQIRAMVKRLDAAVWKALKNVAP